MSERDATKPALLLAAGYNRGALEGDDGTHRLTPTFRPQKRLLIDDEDKDVVQRLGNGEDSYNKVIAIHPNDFHQHLSLLTLLALQSQPGTWQW